MPDRGLRRLREPERLTDADIDARTRGDIGATRTPGTSATLRSRLAAATCGWKRPATEREFYDAPRASEPTSRERNILDAWVTEATNEELFRAWAEGAYAPLRLAAALHRSGLTTCKAASFLNNFGRRSGDEPELSGETLRITPQAGRWTALADQHGERVVLCAGRAGSDPARTGGGLVAGFPARSGMNPKTAAGNDRSGQLPRRRGDEPAMCAALQSPRNNTPQERGELRSGHRMNGRGQ